MSITITTENSTVYQFSPADMEAYHLGIRLGNIDVKPHANPHTQMLEVIKAADYVLDLADRIRKSRREFLAQRIAEFGDDPDYELVVKVEDVLETHARRASINSVPFDRIVWQKDGQPLVIDDHTKSEWKYMGLTNCCFAEMGAYAGIQEEPT